MPITSGESKAFTGLKTVVMYRPVSGNSAGSFGTMPVGPGSTNPSYWPGYVKSFNASHDVEVQAVYGMSCLGGSSRSNPRDQKAGKQSFGWDATIIPQTDSRTALPYYSMKHLWSCAHSTFAGVYGTSDASAVRCATTGTTTASEQDYIQFYRVNLESEATTLGGRGLLVQGAQIADYEMSCSIDNPVEISISGPALSLSTGISDLFGSIENSSYATCITEAAIYWNDTDISIGVPSGAFVGGVPSGKNGNNVKAWSYKKSTSMTPNYRMTSNATTMTKPWCISQGKTTFEVKLTLDFESWEEYNAMANGTATDIYFFFPGTEYIVVRDVLWSGAPINTDADADDLVGIELTGMGEGAAFLVT